MAENKKKDKVGLAYKGAKILDRGINWFRSALMLLERTSRRIAKSIFSENTISLGIARGAGMLYYSLNIFAIYKDPDLSPRHKTLQIAGSVLMLGLIGFVLLGPLGSAGVVAAALIAGIVLNTIYNFTFFKEFVKQIKNKIFPNLDSKLRTQRLARFFTYLAAAALTATVSLVPGVAQIFWLVTAAYTVVAPAISVIRQKIKQRREKDFELNETEANAQGYSQITREAGASNELVGEQKSLIFTDNQPEATDSSDDKEVPGQVTNPGKPKG